MTASRPGATSTHLVSDSCCDEARRDVGWHRGARWARALAYVSLAAMLTEGAMGLWQGLAVASIALTGW
ncbi:MAG TPA: hypothetical protein VE197_19635, partial [Mycobacterium sp.]|nr:hypothetical protein [Mycobacterium sp.]